MVFLATLFALPSPPASAAPLSKIISGAYFTCTLDSAGQASCWGQNSDGQLGNGTVNESTTPVAVSGGLTFSSLVAGDYHACGLTSGGAAYCWGRNNNGQLGDGTTTNRTTPTLVSGNLTFTTISLTSTHTCGLVPGAWPTAGVETKVVN